ncbi:phosphotransferase [Sphaerisporangium sp. B11E5]|uniref:phosphotransferase family protein n=1 Tax=Sphaerisporangium sp. B11E5 TaxID=3153563 RepID=UPI00325E3810
MTTIPGPAERLKHVLTVAGLEPVTASHLIESRSNDTWLMDDARLGPVVLRVCWRGDVSRLGREVAVVQAMPGGVRYPEVVGHGPAAVHDFPLHYSVTRRLTGGPLDLRWPSLTEAERRSAVAQLADMLRELHRWTPPAGLARQVCARPGLEGGGMSALLGADHTPLPVPRAVTMARHAGGLPFIDPGLMADAVATLGELEHLAPAVDDPSRHGLMHGDLNLGNLWWSQDGAVVMMDFEWVRFGPPLLDLQRLCDNADIDTLNGDGPHPAVLRRLAEEYPDAFREDDAAGRMRLYTLAYALRDIVVDPPDRPLDELSPDHSLHRVRRLLTGRWPAPGALPDPLVPPR